MAVRTFVVHVVSSAKSASKLLGRTVAAIDAGDNIAREPGCFHGFVDRSSLVTALRHAHMFSSRKQPRRYGILRYWVAVANDTDKSITEKRLGANFGAHRFPRNARF
jgi:hypothetical protein